MSLLLISYLNTLLKLSHFREGSNDKNDDDDDEEVTSDMDLSRTCQSDICLL
mgnify:CR=1 FL=1